MNKRISRFFSRKGTDLQRYSFILEEGELAYTTDTKRIFSGNNKQDGGNNLSNRTFLLDSLYYPVESLAYDLIFDKSKGVTYIINKISYNFDPTTSTDPTFFKMFDNGKECCDIAKRKIAFLKILRKKIQDDVTSLKTKTV